MTILQAVISGVVQGVTEFFPISSSGHLVLLHSLFGLKDENLAFDVFLHLGTIISVFIFFHKDIIGLFMKSKKTLVLLMAASVPTAVMGIFFKDTVESLFEMPNLVGWMLIITGLWLFAGSLYARHLKRLDSRRPLGLLSALVIGIAQGVSIVPGISRSGSTIATGLLMGLEAEEALRFSFLLSVPAVLGANILKAGKISSGLLGQEAPYFIAGGLTAMLVGLAAIGVLLKLIKRDKLIFFGVYCILVGGLIALG